MSLLPTPLKTNKLLKTFNARIAEEPRFARLSYTYRTRLRVEYGNRVADRGLGQPVTELKTRIKRKAIFSFAGGICGFKRGPIISFSTFFLWGFRAELRRDASRLGGAGRVRGARGGILGDMGWRRVGRKSGFRDQR
jgi:hypothetical protein